MDLAGSDHYVLSFQHLNEVVSATVPGGAQVLMPDVWFLTGPQNHTKPGTRVGKVYTGDRGDGRQGRLASSILITTRVYTPRTIKFSQIVPRQQVRQFGYEISLNVNVLPEGQLGYQYLNPRAGFTFCPAPRPVVRERTRPKMDENSQRMGPQFDAYATCFRLRNI